MAGVVKICFQSILKLVNSIIGMVGMAMIIYAAWMIMVWHRHTGQLPFGHHSPVPWFIYATLGIGSSLCLISLAGHIAAETANGHCLACYMVLIFLLTLLEAAVTADVYLNRDWEADFPKDPTGKFDDLKHFVESNFDFCKRIGLAIVAVQGLSILFSIILRALGPDYGQYSDSDDEYAPERRPLLRNQVPPQSYVVGEPHIAPKNDNWNIRIHDKINR